MKKNWINLFATHFLGVLNDNLLKNVICFVAIFWAAPEDKSIIIAGASATMVLPFIFLSPLAGRLSQHYSKNKIMERAKLLEIPVMFLACFAFYQNSLALVLLSMLLLATLSALLSPSKYGLINDFAGSSNLSKNLGVMEMLSFFAVLLGAVLAGLIADVSAHQTIFICCFLLLLALMGYVTSKNIKTDNVVDAITEKSSINPLTFLKKNYISCKKYKGVNSAIIALAMFWFVGSMLQMNLLVHCSEMMGYDGTETGLITAFVAIGIGVGCYVAGVITNKRLEIGMSFFAAIGLSICIFILSAHSLSNSWFISVLMMASFCGGLFKIPLNAWVQERSDKKELSSVLAYSNMLVFIAILLSALLFGVLQKNLSTYSIFWCIAFVTLLVAMVFLYKTPIYVLRFIVWILAKLIFRARIKGVQNIPVKSGAILVCNHVSLLDSLLILSTAPRNVRYVMHESVYNHKVLGKIFKRCNMIPIGSGKNKEALIEFTNRCKVEIENNHVICIFPEGHLSRNGQIMGFKKGIEFIAEVTKAPIIPMHIDNLVGTPLTYQSGTNKLYRFGLKTLRKKVFVRVGEPVKYPVTAFQLRQIIKDLEVQNVAERIGKMNPLQAANKLKQQVFSKETTFQNIEKITFEELIVNTPNYKVRDLTGTEYQLTGSKINAIGKPLPGVTVAVLDENSNALLENQKGKIYYKHSFSNSLEWIESSYFGEMDEAGFVFVH